MFRKYQIVVWYPEWQGLHFARTDVTKTCMAFIYRWYLFLGFWEVRRWENRREPLYKKLNLNQRQAKKDI